METNHADILLRKIESARFDIAAYPCLEEMAENLVAESLQVFSDVSGGADIDRAGLSASAKECSRALEESGEDRAIYHCELMNARHVIFIGVASNIAAALSEAMLGGKFSIPDSGEKATSVDRAVLCSVADRLLSFFASYSFPAASNAIVSCAPARPITVTDNEVKALQTSAYCNLSLDISSGSASCAAALTFHLPIEFLEERGLLAKERKPGADTGENSRWRSDMTANIHKTEVELDFVLDTYKTQLSELSGLEVDQIIPLSDNPERAIEIILQTKSGRCTIGSGRLGACRESKAVKITSSLDPASFSSA
jgi:flagellar motor switch protein FliM